MKSDSTTGAIASSGVIEAIWDFWEYFEPIRVSADPACISNTQKITNAWDNILIGLNDTATTLELKTAFGLPNVTYDDDFAYVLAYGIIAWQNKNWDPELNDPTFDNFCANITSDTIIYPETENLTATVQDLLKKGGYGSEISNLTTPVLNWIGWLADYAVDGCEGSQDKCFGTHNSTYYAQDDITQDWRPWAYQVRPSPTPLNVTCINENSTAHNTATYKPGRGSQKMSSLSSRASVT